jgi:hypothetical protein
MNSIDGGIHRPLLRWVLVLLLALAPAGATAAFIPVFGGPECNSATGNGYQYFATTDEIQHNFVNNSGIAIAIGSKLVSGTGQGQRAVQFGPGMLATELLAPVLSAISPGVRRTRLTMPV